MIDGYPQGLLLSLEENELLNQIMISGDDQSFQIAIRELCREFINIFRPKVSLEPAKLLSSIVYVENVDAANKWVLSLVITLPHVSEQSFKKPESYGSLIICWR